MNAANTAPNLPPPAQPLLRRSFEVALIVLVFFIMAGDPAPHRNEPHYLGRLKHFWDPTWCAGDLFLQSADAQVAFVWTFGWLTRWLSLTATAWVGRIAAWTLLAWAWQRLSWRLVPRPLASVLSAAIFVTLIAVAHLAGEWVVGGVEAKCFAYFFVLLALREMVDRRWNAVWFAVGTATAFHPIVGGWSGLVCGGIWFVNDRRAVSLAAMLPGFICGGLLALVGILPALMLTYNVSPQVSAESARIYVFERLPHHLALLALPTDEVMLRIGRHAALVAILWSLMRGANTFTESPSLLRRIGQFAWGAVAIAVAGFAIELVLWNQPLWAAKVLRYYWFRLTDVAVPIAVALYSVAIIAVALERRRSWGPWALTTVLVLVGWQLSDVARQRALNPVPPADEKVLDFPAWAETCEWISENTPSDALFLTPRSSQSFKWRTSRAEVATRKDLPQDARNMVEWFGRLTNIFRREVNGVVEWVDSPGALGTTRIQELADEYGFDFVVTDDEVPLALPIAYRNGPYVVYRIKK